MLTKQNISRLGNHVEAFDILREKAMRMRSALEGSFTGTGSEIDKGRHANAGIDIKLVPLLQLEELLKTKGPGLEARCERMRQRIEQIQDERQRRIIIMRDIDGLQWAEISKEIGPCERQCRRIYDDGINKICGEIK